MTRRERFHTVTSGGIWKDTWYAGDYFEGSAEALIVASLCARHKLPGQPGCGKRETTFAADGTRSLKGMVTEPGRRQIRQTSKDWFRVRVTVSRDEQLSRAERYSTWAKERRTAATYDAASGDDSASDATDSERRRRLGDDFYTLVVQRKHLSVVPSASR